MKKGILNYCHTVIGVISLIFIMIVVSQVSAVFAADKVVGEDEIQADISSLGRSRVIVTFQDADINRLLVSANDQPASGGHGTSSKASQIDAELSRMISRTSEKILVSLPTDSFSHKRTFSYSPGMVLEVDGAALEQLKINETVSVVQKDGLSKAIENSGITPGNLNLDDTQLVESTSLIAAESAWNKGVTGNGVYVAVLDTGVKTNHEMFVGKNIIEACFSTTYGPYQSTTVCPNGQNVQVGSGAAAPNAGDHGTHVAGIALGNNTSHSPGEPLSGVAHGADLVAVQIFSRFDSFDICGGVPPVISLIPVTRSQLSNIYTVFVIPIS